MSHSELTTILEAETLAQDPTEERVTQRLRDYWDTLRGGQQFPSRANFRMEAVTGLGPHAFALDLPQGADEPVFRFVGKALTDDCGKDFTLKPLSAVSALPTKRKTGSSASCARSRAKACGPRPVTASMRKFARDGNCCPPRRVFQ